MQSPFEVPELQIHCEVVLHCWTTDWAAKLTAVESDYLHGCPDNGTKSLWSVSAGNKSSFSLSNYIPLWRCFSTIQLILKSSTDTKFNQNTTSHDVRWQPQALISPNLWNKHRDKILIEICECGRWTEFAETSVCIILVVLVYLESAKNYTVLKIVLGSKRLRTTTLDGSISLKFLLETRLKSKSLISFLVLLVQELG